VCVHGNSVAPGPIAQLLIQRDGSIDVIAAGAANNAGSGVLPDGSTNGNGRTYGIEAVNAGRPFRWDRAASTCTYGATTFTLSAAATATMTGRADRREIMQRPGGDWLEVWSEQMLVGYAAANRTLLDHHGWGTDRLLAHAAYAPTRKIDPWGPWPDAPTVPLDHHQWMTRMRGLVDAVSHHPLPPPVIPPGPPQEDTKMIAVYRPQGDPVAGVTYATDYASCWWVPDSQALDHLIWSRKVCGQPLRDAMTGREITRWADITEVGHAGATAFGPFTGPTPPGARDAWGRRA
jgi:hypothetical protein